MERAIAEGEEMHTFRVLYRVQDEQLTLLRSYDSRTNNIYFTDFESDALGILSKDEADTARSVRSFSRNPRSFEVRDLTEEIRIAGKSYFANRDLYYMIQLVDLSCALWVLKDLKKARLWAMKGKQDLRATCFGPIDRPSELHVIAFRDKYPGVYGKLLKCRQWGKFMKDSRERTKPNELANKRVAANCLVTEHLQPFASEIRKNYPEGACFSNNFVNLTRFVNSVENWSPEQVIEFVKDKREDAFNRAAVENELRQLDLHDFENRILR
jgi:hypothetical protein